MRLSPIDRFRCARDARRIRHIPARVRTHRVLAEAGQFRKVLEADPRRNIEVTEIPHETRDFPLTGAQLVVRTDPSNVEAGPGS